jgi:hypothetical protein
LQQHRTTQQKEPRQPTAFVQWWGRSNGKGNPRVGYVADRQDRRPNPDRGSPGRTNGNAVSIRESELDHRRPCAPSLPLHDPIKNQSALPAQRGIDKLRAECLTGDIRPYKCCGARASERSYRLGTSAGGRGTERPVVAAAVVAALLVAVGCDFPGCDLPGGALLRGGVSTDCR